VHRVILILVSVVMLAGSNCFAWELQLQQLFNQRGYQTNVWEDEIVGDVFFQIQQDQVAVIDQLSALDTSSAIGWYTKTSSNNWLVGGTSTLLPTSEKCLPSTMSSVFRSGPTILTRPIETLRGTQSNC